MKPKDKKTWAVALSCLLLILAAAIYQRRAARPETHTLMEGTAVETSYTILKGKVPGKTIFVVGGIHGDETSGWRAADELKKLPKPQSGTLIILSPANAPGARAAERNVEQYRDLNRSFPGGRNRDLTDQLAASIYQAIEAASPDLVLDLHEAYREEGNRDFLGNSIIFTGTEGIEELVSSIVLETHSGDLCTKPFTYYGPAPNGSLNRVVTEELHIPVITVEASKEDPEAERIQNHIAIVQRIAELLQQ